MSKALLVLLTLGLSLLVGCSSPTPAADDSNKADAGASSSTDTATGGDESSELANPVVDVSGPDDFQNQLGLYLAADDLGSSPVYSIISNQTAQVIYQDEVGGQTVEVIVRVQKTSAEEDISGDFNQHQVVEPGKTVGEITPTLHFTEGKAGYATWFNPTVGTSGSVSLSTAASADELNVLAEYYINQGNRGQ
ncbi:MAG: hypothetical protein LBR39_00750 [Coriobacteriales bacterium]|jgi:hypothetical protein|nr:hypothetical protein [Coriobacteriales bacterium]